MVFEFFMLISVVNLSEAYDYIKTFGRSKFFT